MIISRRLLRLHGRLLLPNEAWGLVRSRSLLARFVSVGSSRLTVLSQERVLVLHELVEQVLGSIDT